MPQISITGPHISGDVGHYRVSVDFGDRLVEYDPAFEVVGLSNAVRARAVAKELCASTANSLVKEHVPLDVVLRVIATLVGAASPEELRKLEPVV